MLSKKIEKALNEQVVLEAMASQYYLAMASWCDSRGFQGMASFLYAQSDEERMHMLKIFHYIQDMDGHALTPALDQPKLEYGSVPELFSDMLNHEKTVSAAIFNLLKICQQEDDQSTYNFLQWYVTEQREEEAQVKSILDQIKILGIDESLTNNVGLYHLDQSLKNMRGE